MQKDFEKSMDENQLKKMKDIFGKKKGDNDADEDTESAKEKAEKMTTEAFEKVKARAEHMAKNVTEKVSRTKIDSDQSDDDNTQTDTAANAWKKQMKSKYDTMFESASNTKEQLSDKLNQTKEDLGKKAQTFAQHEKVQETMKEGRRVKDKAEKETKKIWEERVERTNFFTQLQQKVSESEILDGWGDAAKELIGKNKNRRKVVQLHTTEPKPMHAEAEGEMAETGSAIMNVSQPKSSWQRITESIRETPLISDMLKSAAAVNKEFAQSDAGKAATKAKNSFSDTAFDLREKWETSQNPWVYRISGWSDALFAETEIGNAVREVKRFDPGFDIHVFLQDLEDDTLATLINCYATADNDTLRNILSEAAYAQVYASFKQRAAAGLTMDPTIIDIKEPALVFAKCQEKEAPLFLVSVPVQQVHCIYDRDGAVAEGAPDKVYTNVYMFALQQQVDEFNSEIPWKVREVMMMMDIYEVDGKKKAPEENANAE